MARAVQTSFGAEQAAFEQMSAADDGYRASRPEGSFERYWRISDEPPHTLNRTLISNVTGAGTALYVRLPDGVDEDDFYRYFTRFNCNPIPFEPAYWHERRDAVIGAALQDGERSAGSVNFSGDGTVDISLNTSRPRAFSDREIFTLFLAAQKSAKEWRGVFPSPELYVQCLIPALREFDRSDPVAWGAACLEVFAGYATVLVGRDLPLPYIHEIVAAVAPLVCPRTNAPEPPRRFVLPAGHESVFRSAISLAAPSAQAEWAFVLLSVFSDELPISESLTRLATSLEAAVQAGCNIRQFAELGEELRNKGMAPGDRAELLGSILTSMYGHPKNASDLWCPPDGPAESTLSAALAHGDGRFVTLLAKCAGRAFPIALKAAADNGFALATHPDIAVEDSARAYAAIAASYGLADIQRATRVLSFASEMVAQSPNTDAAIRLRRFVEYACEKAPSSPVIGRMQDETATLHLPGMSLLVRSLCPSADQGGDDHMLQLSQIDDLEYALRRPLSERGHARPALARGRNHAPLLTSDTIPMALGSAGEVVTTTDTRPLVVRYLDLKERLGAELGYGSDDVLCLYVTLCAAKLPDPFDPPPGILSALAALKDIPAKGTTFEYLAHPREREEIRRTNRELTVDKYLTLTTLLDAVNLGFLDLPEASRILQWAFERTAPEDITLIEQDAMWDARETAEERWANYHGMLARIDGELRRTEEGWEARLGPEGNREQARVRSALDRVRSERRQLEETAAREEYGLDAGERIEVPDPASLDELRITREISLRVSMTDRERAENRWERVGRLADSIRMAFVLGRANLLGVGDARNALTEAIRQLDRPADGTTKTDYFEALNNSDWATRLATGLERLNAVGALNRETVTVAFRQAVDSGTPLMLAGELEWERDLVLPDDLTEASILRQAGFCIVDSKSSVRTAVADVIRDHCRARSSAIARTRFIDAVAARDVSIELSDSSLDFLHALEDMERTKASSVGVDSSLAEGMGRTLLRRIRASRSSAESTTEPALVARELGLAVDDDVKSFIIRSRVASFGLLPVGGKVQMLHQADTVKVELLNRVFRSNHSTFRLQHANTTLLLPPFPSAGEMMLACGLLSEYRVIDTDRPELQLAVPGRLPPKECAILGASMLLGTTVGVAYNPQSFKTSHDDEVQYRIMTYDAGGHRLTLPFCPTEPGRTDMLGRRTSSDFIVYQRVATALASELCDGPFRDLGRWYREEFRGLLTDAGMGGVLEASWIAEHGARPTPRAGSDHFNHAIKPCIDAFAGCARRYKETGETTGLIFEVRKLQDELARRMELVQRRMLESPEFEDERRWLFGDPAMPDSNGTPE